MALSIEQLKLLLFAAVAKQHVVVALHLANFVLKYAARQQLSTFAEFMTFDLSQFQNSCCLRYCRLLCVAVASISGRRVAKSASHDS